MPVSKKKGASAAVKPARRSARSTATAPPEEPTIQLKTIFIRVLPEDHLRVKKYAVENLMTMEAVGRQALAEFLKKVEKGKKTSTSRAQTDKTDQTDSDSEAASGGGE